MNTQDNKLTLPNNKNGQIVHLEQAEIFSGPVPHPEIIERYEKIYPGAAKIIFEEWDNQVKHRQNIEKSVIKTDNTKSLLGVVFGFISVMVAIIVGAYLAIKGLDLFGGGLTLVGLVMLATAFKTSREKEENNKKD